MTKVLDVAQQADGDIDLNTGDILWKDGTKQHQRDTLLTSKGELLDAPAYGAGITDYLQDNNSDDLFRRIRQELGKDGQTVSSLKINETGEIEIDANY